MTDKLIEQLRISHEAFAVGKVSIFTEAADELERLKAYNAEHQSENLLLQMRNEKLEAALYRIGHNICISAGADKQMREIALAALGDGDD